MSTVYADLVEGNRARQLKDGRYEHERVFIVSGQSGSDALIDSLAEAGIPALGAAHPDDATAFCEERIPESIGIDKCRITCVYRTPAHTTETVEISATLAEREVVKDTSDAEIKVTYTGTELGDEESVKRYTPTVGFPHVIRVVRRGASTNSPITNALAFVGKVNHATWTTGAVRTWRCNRVSGVTQDNGTTWDNEAEWEYNPDTWDVTVAWKHASDNSLPADLDANSLKTFIVCQTANMTTMVL